MDLVQLSELISQSPYSLPTFLIIVVWWAADAIKRKDNDIKEMYQKMKEHFEEDAAKYEKRETFYHTLIDWFKWIFESENDQVIDKRSLKKAETLLIEGREHFESDNGEDKIPPNPVDDGGPITRFRRKLSAGRKAK
jgi:hypothetical protein